MLLQMRCILLFCFQKSGRDPSKDFKLTKTPEGVSAAFRSFIDGNLAVLVS